MDLRALREEAIEATSRALFDRHGMVPSEDSEEWEEEYRRQFAALKTRYANGAAPATSSPPPAPAAAPAAAGNWPELSGAPEQTRWAATIREARLKEVPNEAMRVWLARAWTRAKLWIDTREVPTAVLLQRLRPQFEDYRQKAAAQREARAAEEQKRAAEAAAYRERLQAAGVTPENLVELIDASERADPAALGRKLAEIAIDGRALRIFETSDPNILLVKEKNAEGQEEYGIERDEGLVEDLRLFAQAP